MDLYSLMSTPHIQVALVVGIVVTLNNIFMNRWFKKYHHKDLERVSHAHAAERVRATETINALRGIIYAFKDAQQLEREEKQSDKLLKQRQA